MPLNRSRPSATRLLPARRGEEGRGGCAYPASQTPWQEIYRANVDQLNEGMVMKGAVKFQKVAQSSG